MHIDPRHQQAQQGRGTRGVHARVGAHQHVIQSRGVLDQAHILKHHGARRALPRRQRKQRRLAHARGAHHAGAPTGGHTKHQPVERRRPGRTTAHGKRKLRRSAGASRVARTPAQAASMRQHRRTPRRRPRSPQQPHQHALACPRSHNNQHGPGQQISRLNQKLCLIDALTHGAHRHADQLRRHAGLPAHANHGAGARKHKRQDFAPDVGTKQSPTPHAMQTKHLLQRFIRLRQALDQRKIHSRQRHQKDRRNAYARRPQPNEQQDHHAGNRRRLNKRKRRSHQAGKRPRARRNSGQQTTAHRGKRQTA